MSNTAYIYDAIRTPRSKGKPGGSLHEVKPIDLGAGLLRALQERHDLDTSYVDDVVMGCVSPIGEQGSDIAKMIVQNAGWDESVAGVQLNRFCASGLEAVNTGAQKIASGWEQLVVAGGVECMSRVPMGSDGGAMAGDAAFAISQSFVPQGIGADTIATIDGYSRDDVDAYAVESQRRATHARDNGYFDKSVIPVRDKNGLMILEKDDFIKPDTTMEALAGLKPSFEMMGNMAFDEIILNKYSTLENISHVHTPGNSSGIVDGASAVLIGSEQAGKDLNLTPRGRIVAGSILAS
ncbi:MAG: acetyl-CoA C-acyltransferase, partial [Porticoccaceae bacterium]|nr:acetyl-CoA C-acyltransferase [Porticoccaceae bacterium]